VPPILFVHGLWHRAWCWEEHFVPWFQQRGYEARAITLRRHDQRHAPGLRTMRIRDYVEDVAAAARMYGAELSTFPGAHDLMLEPGWEKVAERIDAFIRTKVPAGTS
jgi:alpha-beta hydrolase superfamily lysophospholipase